MTKRGFLMFMAYLALVVVTFGSYVYTTQTARNSARIARQVKENCAVLDAATGLIVSYAKINSSILIQHIGSTYFRKFQVERSKADKEFLLRLRHIQASQKCEVPL